LAGGEQLKMPLLQPLFKSRAPHSHSRANKLNRIASVTRSAADIDQQPAALGHAAHGGAGSVTDQAEAFVEFFPPQVNAFLCVPF
jgi:hypothetical protein